MLRSTALRKKQYLEKQIQELKREKEIYLRLLEEGLKN